MNDEPVVSEAVSSDDKESNEPDRRLPVKSSSKTERFWYSNSKTDQEEIVQNVVFLKSDYAQYVGELMVSLYPSLGW